MLSISPHWSPTVSLLWPQNTDGCSFDQNEGPAPEDATHEHQELSCEQLSPPTQTTTTGEKGKNHLCDVWYFCVIYMENYFK